MLWHKKMPTQMAGFRLPCELKYIAKVDIIFKYPNKNRLFFVTFFISFFCTSKANRSFSSSACTTINASSFRESSCLFSSHAIKYFLACLPRSLFSIMDSSFAILIDRAYSIRLVAPISRSTISVND